MASLIRVWKKGFDWFGASQKMTKDATRCPWCAWSPSQRRWPSLNLAMSCCEEKEGGGQGGLPQAIYQSAADTWVLLPAWSAMSTGGETKQNYLCNFFWCSNNRETQTSQMFKKQSTNFIILSLQRHKPLYPRNIKKNKHNSFLMTVCTDRSNKIKNKMNGNKEKGKRTELQKIIR